MTLTERFWSKVLRSADSECWPWTGSRQTLKRGEGYGTFFLRKRPDGRHRVGLSHRVAWELTNGPIPSGLEICHRCDNRLCCNPNHMFVGTRSDNMRDAVNKGRHVSGFGIWWKRRLAEKQAQEVA